MGWFKKHDQYTHNNLLKQNSTYQCLCFLDLLSDSLNMFVEMVMAYLTRSNTILQSCISVEIRLAVISRYLATGIFCRFEILCDNTISWIGSAVLETYKVFTRVLQNCMA